LAPQIPGGGGTLVIRPSDAHADTRLIVQADTSRIDPRVYRVASVAGAEPRLVLRIVTPTGLEDRAQDELLPGAVLDNLRKLFARLPDGHYRIYQVQPDGAERLVVDVVVRQGRSIESNDEQLEEAEAVEDGELLPAQPVPAPAAEPAAAPLGAVDPEEHHSNLATALAAGGAMVLAGGPRLRRRIIRPDQADNERLLSKARRLLRRAK
jgi:hypothetical protein